MGMRGNLRRHERHPAAVVAQISWATSSGEARVLRVRCLDVSESGMRLQSSQMIPLRTYVTVRPENDSIKVPGQGSVRYCLRCRDGYHVGLEFSTPVIFDATSSEAPGVAVDTLSQNPV
jgi:hypothetical protein